MHRLPSWPGLKPKQCAIAANKKEGPLEAGLETIVWSTKSDQAVLL
jgi:hypothetical protein